MSQKNSRVYSPSLLEKIFSIIAAAWIICLASILIIRNQPLDQNIAVLMRILLSLGISILGAVIPGFLKVSLSGRGIIIRAGGALALFIITLFFTPKVFPVLSNPVYPWDSAHMGMPQLNGDFMRFTKSTASPNVIKEELTKLIQPQLNLISLMKAAERKPSSLSRPSKLVALYNYLSMAYYQLAAIAKYRALNETEVQTAVRYQEEAISYAMLCVEFADKGLNFNNKILNTDCRELSRQLNIWSEDLYRISQQILREYNFSYDLTWHRTAGRAILAYYNKIPFIESHHEVNTLKANATIKDPPEDDPTMRWVLSSSDGRRPN